MSFNILSESKISRYFVYLNENVVGTYTTSDSALKYAHNLADKTNLPDGVHIAQHTWKTKDSFDAYESPSAISIIWSSYEI